MKLTFTATIELYSTDGALCEQDIKCLAERLAGKIDHHIEKYGETADLNEGEH